MKRFLFVVFSLFLNLLFFHTKIAQAQGGMMGLNEVESSDTETTQHGESIETVLQAILEKQGSTTIQEVSCDEISEDDLEQLGDAVMEQQHPGEAHEVMDRMMGGEGSESLRQVHIRMGSRYLGCGTSYSQGMMTGGSMMGLRDNESNNFYPRDMSMMGWGGNLFGIQSGLTWFAFISFLLSGIYFFIKKASNK